MLAAWLLATGSHWDLIQTFAWGRMIATYSRTMPLAQAVRLTFTPDNLCGVCKSVSEAKQQQDAAVPGEASSKAAGKILLVFEPRTAWSADLPSVRGWVAFDPHLAGRDRSPPPVPPPRVSVG